MALHGWDDLIFTHISARVPGPEHHFLINPYGFTFDEITASSLVKVGMDGHAVDGSDATVNPAGFTIHSAVHEAREDAGCVIHVHTPDGTAVATAREGLKPLNQTAQLVIDDLAYHDYEGVALDHDERPRLQQDLGNKNLMLLRNHGTLTLGRTVAEAFLRMYFLERACTMQVRTRILGTDDYPTHPDVIDKNEKIGHGFRDVQRGQSPAVAGYAAQAGPDRCRVPELRLGNAFLSEGSSKRLLVRLPRFVPDLAWVTPIAGRKRQGRLSRPRLPWPPDARQPILRTCRRSSRSCAAPA